MAKSYVTQFAENVNKSRKKLKIYRIIIAYVV